MRKRTIPILSVLVLTLLFCGVACAQGEKVVSLPYFDTPGFIPYYWQPQHILAQGTIFEGLFGYAPNPELIGGVEVIPLLAESYEVSEDYKVWTFKLREDKKWSNGDPVTARDFEWSFRYYASPKIPDFPAWAGPLQFFDNFWAVKSGALPEDKLGVRAIDDYTLEITLYQPKYDLKEWLCTAQGVPLHKGNVEADPENWWKPGNIVVNGPYIPQYWTPGEEMALVRNPNYVGEVGNVDKIILKFGGPGIQQYQAGELDAVFIQNVAEYKFVLADPELSQQFHETLMDPFWYGYQISRGFDPLMDNKQLRQALAMAIDRELLCEQVLGGRAIPLASYWPKGTPIGDKLQDIPYDVEKAKELLAEAGFPNGEGLKELVFYIPSGDLTAEYIAGFIVDQWKKNLGVNCIIENIEVGVYTDAYVWANFTPEAKAGFTTIGGPMNNLEIGALFKNADHTIWFYDYPAEVRKRLDEFDKEYDAWLRKEGGQTEEDMQALVEKKELLLAGFNEILENEPEELWREELTRPPLWYEQFDELYEKWNAAETPSDKTDYWRLAGRVLTEQERFQVEYNGRNETNKEAYRWRLRTVNRPFDEAVEIAHNALQIIQDQYWMVPVYLIKAQWLQNPKLEGLMVYKFSWGPGFFNFKYLNLAD